MSRLRAVTRVMSLLLVVLVLLGAPGLAPRVLAEEGQPPTRVVIPAIGLDAAVEVAGVVVTPGGPLWDVPEDAAGWHATSARLGEAGNLVLSGHHNTGGMVFRDLHDLVVGDLIYLYAGEEVHTYAVAQRVVLRETGATPARRQANAHWIRATDDERLTLVTCYPWWTNSHRLIVVARPLEGQDKAAGASVAMRSARNVPIN